MANSLVKLALLIDGDNVSATYMPLIEREATRHGVLAVRRLYGQFTSGRMKTWLKQVEAFNLTKVDVSPLTKGKNATDLKLTVEAMDMLHTRQFDGFCIASSDGDFTPLVARIRAGALACYGFGMKKAPAGYKDGFDRFYECDTLLADEKKGVTRRRAGATPKPPALQRESPARESAAAKPRRTPGESARPVQPPPASQQLGTLPARGREVRSTQAAVPARASARESRTVPAGIVDAILTIVRDKGGRSTLQDVGNALPKAVPQFKAGDYGFGTTKSLIKTLNDRHGIEVTKDGEVILRAR